MSCKARSDDAGRWRGPHRSRPGPRGCRGEPGQAARDEPVGLIGLVLQPCSRSDAAPVEVAELLPCLGPDEPGPARSAVQTQADGQVVGRPLRIAQPQLRQRPVEVGRRPGRAAAATTRSKSSRAREKSFKSRYSSPPIVERRPEIRAPGRQPRYRQTERPLAGRDGRSSCPGRPRPPSSEGPLARDRPELAASGRGVRESIGSGISIRRCSASSRSGIVRGAVREVGVPSRDQSPASGTRSARASSSGTGDAFRARSRIRPGRVARQPRARSSARSRSFLHVALRVKACAHRRRTSPRSSAELRPIRRRELRDDRPSQPGRVVEHAVAVGGLRQRTSPSSITTGSSGGKCQEGDRPAVRSSPSQREDSSASSR